MRYPIEYGWWLDGHALIGEATVNIGSTSVSYDVRGNMCELVLDEGESLTAELSVRATDSGGVVLTADEYIEIEGTRETMSVHGLELLMGPPFLELMKTMKIPTLKDTPIMPYPDEARFVAKRPEGEWRSRRSLVVEQRSALLATMGLDFPIEDFH